jgi:L-Ala-D/L-Glu epimerase
MSDESIGIGPLKLRVESEKWPLRSPFCITHHTFETSDVVVVTLEKEGLPGRGEAAGVYYRGDDITAMMRQIESVRRRVEAGIARSSLQAVLPPGGARNALDCALWDLEAKVVGRPAWELAGLDRPAPLLTTFTCGADTPDRMAETALSYVNARAIKLKLTGEPQDVDRVRAVRAARPDVWLGVDANQGFTRPFLDQVMPLLVESRVELIEQPFPVGQDTLLEGFRSPIAIAADESAQSLVDVAGLASRFQVINIKLDKCGGLTEALAMARAARALGLQTMVGNMIGTSLATAPAFLLGQLCKVVDLDGPLFLRDDRAVPVRYVDGLVTCPDEVWGGAAR